VHGLRAINHVHLERLPRMADFSLWAAACETAVWPAGTLARVYGSQPHSCHREHPQLPPTEASILMRRGRASPNCRRDDRFAKNGRWKRVCVRRRPIEIARGVCGHMIPTCGRRRSYREPKAHQPIERARPYPGPVQEDEASNPHVLCHCRFVHSQNTLVIAILAERQNEPKNCPSNQRNSYKNR
jgi:hypothetical protein